MQSRNILTMHIWQTKCKYYRLFALSNVVLYFNCACISVVKKEESSSEEESEEESSEEESSEDEKKETKKEEKKEVKKEVPINQIDYPRLKMVQLPIVHVPTIIYQITFKLVCFG